MSGRRANEGMIVLGKKSKLPSPCVGICKEKRGVCIACGRDEDDEKAWKRADGLAEKLALLADCSRNTQKLEKRRFLSTRRSARRYHSNAAELPFAKLTRRPL